MIEYCIRCDKCGIRVHEVHAQCKVMDRDEIHLCELCTKVFEEWLDNENNDDSDTMLSKE